MPTAPSEQDIRDSFDSHILAVDPSIDTRKGGIPFAIRNPTAKVIASAEGRVLRLNSLYSTAFLQYATDEELAAIANNFAKSSSFGRSSRGPIKFYTSTQPSEDCFAAAGTIVATANSRLKYRTLQDALIPYLDSSVYYNASARRWETIVQAEAIGVGETYDVPPDRIIRILTAVTGFEGATNTSRFTRGSAEPGRETLMVSIQNALIAGKDLGTVAGQRSLVLSQVADTLVLPTEEAERIIYGVSMVMPSDGKAFPRRTSRPAMDIVVLLEESVYTDAAIEDFYVTSTNQRTFVLTKPPVRSVVSVKKNGVETTAYSLLLDSTKETRHSGRASDSVVLDNSVTTAVNDIITIQYVHNSIISDLQSQETSLANLFGTDILYREPEQVEVEVIVEITPMITSAVDESTRENVKSVVDEYFTRSIAGTYRPEILRDVIKDTLIFSAIVRILKFCKTVSGVTDVEVISLAKNESPFIDFDVDTDIIIRR